MKTTSVAAMTFVLTSLSIPLAQSAPMKGSDSGVAGNQHGRMFDPKTVETVKGEVVKIDKLSPNQRMSKGVHITLKTKNGEIPVHLGPEWFLERQDLQISSQDILEVKGSRITFDGKPAIIASEIHKGSNTLKLRDDNGIPAWTGWRRRG